MFFITWIFELTLIEKPVEYNLNFISSNYHDWNKHVFLSGDFDGSCLSNRFLIIGTLPLDNLD